MKIAVTSQNRRDVTGHAGRCRNFWIFEIEDGIVLDRQLLELQQKDSFHDSLPHASHPLDGVEVLITGGMGEGLQMRLARRGIEALVTTETDPERAVQAWLEGCLPCGAPRPHRHGMDDGEGEIHACGGHCICH
jgi:predicted Fe-Mo cluster-binding NifX family protein